MKGNKEMYIMKENTFKSKSKSISGISLKTDSRADQRTLFDKTCQEAIK